MSLSTQTKNFFITIRKNKLLTGLEDFIQKQEGLETYAFIKHEGDISPDTHKVEGIHYHIALIRKKTRISTMYKAICDFFNFDTVGIKVECMKSLEGSIQYLTHQNNSLKTPHNASEIITNLSGEELKQYLSVEINALTYEYIYNVCYSANDVCDIIQTVGFTRYNMFRNTIQDIYKAVLLRKRKEKIRKEMEIQGILQS